MTDPYRSKIMPWHARNGRYRSETCCLCHRRLRVAPAHRMVHIIEGGSRILHPEDEELYQTHAPRDGSDLGYHAIGADCAQKIGRHWTVIIEGNLCV